MRGSLGNHPHPNLLPAREKGLELLMVMVVSFGGFLWCGNGHSLEVGLADNFFDLHVEEIISIDCSDDDGGIRTSTRPGNSDDIFADADESGIRCHKGHFADYFHPLTEDA